MRLSKNLLTFFIAFLLFLGSFACLIAKAEEDVDTQTSIVILTIPCTCNLEIQNADSSKILIQDDTSELAFDAGYVDLDAGRPTLLVSANNTWQLTAKSSGFDTINGYTKDIGDLQLKDTGNSHVTLTNFTSLSATEQEVATALVGVKDEEHPIQYRILLDYRKDIPGTYTATVTYTLTTSAE
jgi:hypothetical protein